MCVCAVAKGKVKGCQEVLGIGQSPYLVRSDRAGGHLLNGQGLLQRGAQRGAVVAATTRPDPPATRNKDWVTQGNPLGCLWGSGKSRGRTCRATREASTVPKAPKPPSPWPQPGSRERAGVRLRQEGRRMRGPPPACRGERKSGRDASPTRPGSDWGRPGPRPGPAHRQGSLHGPRGALIPSFHRLTGFLEVEPAGEERELKGS